MKRYEHYCSWDGGGPADPEEDANGDWVKYGDAQAEIAALRKDAERYRWIRNEAGDDAAEMDRAIDSARLLVLPNVL